MELIHQKNIKIIPENCNENGKLKLPVLLDFLQTAAGEHADILHFGIKDLNKENDTWVLSRLRIEIEKWPAAGETIVLKTWPKGIDRLFAIRDFMVYDNDENITIKAASYWLIVDRNTKRPKIPDDEFLKREYPDISAIDKKIDKIPPLSKPEYSSQFVVTDNEIDINGHVNNVWYAHWIMESIPQDVREKMDIACFEINYLSEVFAGENITAETGKSTDDPSVMLGSIKKENKDVCRVKIMTR